jgi:hypothetical protein
MTKKALQKQIDELKSALLLHAVRIEALEAMLTWMPYMVTNSMGAPLPFPGSTTTCNNESTQEERYGNK